MATLVDRLRKPSAFFSSNWAGILFLLMGATAVPALAGVTRVVTGLNRHADEGFVTVVRTVKATWRRDLPLSLALVVDTGAGAVAVGLGSVGPTPLRVTATVEEATDPGFPAPEQAVWEHRRHPWVAVQR